MSVCVPTQIIISENLSINCFTDVRSHESTHLESHIPMPYRHGLIFINSDFHMSKSCQRPIPSDNSQNLTARREPGCKEGRGGVHDCTQISRFGVSISQNRNFAQNSISTPVPTRNLLSFSAKKQDSASIFKILKFPLENFQDRPFSKAASPGWAASPHGTCPWWPPLCPDQPTTDESLS